MKLERKKALGNVGLNPNTYIHYITLVAAIQSKLLRAGKKKTKYVYTS